MLHTYSWLSTQEDVQITNHAARWSCLNWCLLSSPLPLCIVIRSLSTLCLRAALRWHLVTIQHLPAWSVSTYPPHGHSQSMHDGPLPRDEVVCGLGLQHTLNFKLLLKRKLLRAGITITFLASLMNITDIYDYITEYSTFNFGVCSFSFEQRVLAITKSRTLLLIGLIK